MSDRECINYMIDVCLDGENILVLMDNGDIYNFQKKKTQSPYFILNDIKYSNSISLVTTEYGYISADYVDHRVEYVLNTLDGRKKTVGTWKDVDYVLIGSSFLIENDGKVLSGFTTKEKIIVLDLLN